ncbi:MAG: saccharopine dehydrogenase NADP-binding domain-containing protein [Solirubrobacteraceae bacterium]|nr:saccharopine dehydrogenase NADP-binding domain-containing protein [Solirubrobacteraceae bacterium]
MASPRIVLFGATGYTGDLTARELVRRGLRPLLAARSAERVAALADELGGLEHAVADVGDPASVAALVARGDVLVSTVGPFLRWGDPAVEAAIAAGAHYLDSTGEGPFIRRVFEEFGPRAEAAGCALLTAMGYDWVPGNLAGALALREAGGEARRVELGYFMSGVASANGMSGGTRASAAGALIEPTYTFRDGRIVTERGGRRVRSFDLGDGRTGPGISIGSSEQFALPRLEAQLWDVDTYLGWFGPASRPLQAFSLGTEIVTKVPGVRAGIAALAGRFVSGSTGGPDAEARSGTRSVILARACDAAGRELCTVRLEGPNGYDLTAAFLAWGAETAAAGGLRGVGALGPVDGFGLDELEAAAASYELVRVA